MIKFLFIPVGMHSEKVLIASSVSIRCSYHYDAFGNLYTKNCTDGSHRYLIDPFGTFGSDVIGEVSFAVQQYYATVSIFCLGMFRRCPVLVKVVYRLNSF